MRRAAFVAIALLAVSPAYAQHAHHDHGAPPPEQADPHAGHTMPVAPAAESGAQGDPHASHGSHGSHGSGTTTDRAREGSAPPAPSDHAADAIYGAERMAQARRGLARESGYFRGSMIRFDLAEFQHREDGEGYRWEGEAWYGGDLEKLLIRTEGEGTFGEPIEQFEAQILYSRAVSPYWNMHLGLRHDVVPNPSRTHAVLGLEGTAPYWLHLSAQLFVSNKGEVSARIEGNYDQRLTQSLILTPSAELNLAAQDVPVLGIGSGLTDIELGLRLRYEISPKFAPYAGLEWSAMTGDSRRFARAAGQSTSETALVAGVRFWF